MRNFREIASKFIKTRRVRREKTLSSGKRFLHFLD